MRTIKRWSILLGVSETLHARMCPQCPQAVRSKSIARNHPGAAMFAVKRANGFYCTNRRARSPRVNVTVVHSKSKRSTRPFQSVTGDNMRPGSSMRFGIRGPAICANARAWPDRVHSRPQEKGGMPQILWLPPTERTAPIFRECGPHSSSRRYPMRVNRSCALTPFRGEESWPEGNRKFRPRLAHTRAARMTRMCMRASVSPPFTNGAITAT